MVRKTPTLLYEKKTGWRQQALIHCVDVHMELTSRPHASIWAWPLPPPCGRHKRMAPYYRHICFLCMVRYSVSMKSAIAWAYLGWGFTGSNPRNYSFTVIKVSGRHSQRPSLYSYCLCYSMRKKSLLTRSWVDETITSQIGCWLNRSWIDERTLY